MAIFDKIYLERMKMSKKSQKIQLSWKSKKANHKHSPSTGKFKKMK